MANSKIKIIKNLINKIMNTPNSLYARTKRDENRAKLIFRSLSFREKRKVVRHFNEFYR